MAKSSLIGRISFDLVANTGKLLAPLKKAQSAVGGFVSSLNPLAGIGGKIAASLAGVVAAATGLRGISNAFRDLGNLSDESKRLGIPAEMLSAIQYAAQQAGVEITTLGKSLQFMMKQGFSPSQLAKIADEFERIKDPVEKMQKALRLFGRGGAGMLNVLEGGGAALRAKMAEGKSLGVVVSQKDADAVEKAGDALARIWEGLKGVANTFAIELAPSVYYIAELITGAIKWLIPAIKSGFKWITDAYIKLQGAWIDGILMIEAAVLKLTAFVLELVAKIPGAEFLAGIASGARKRVDEILTMEGGEAMVRKWLASLYVGFMSDIGGGGRFGEDDELGAGKKTDMSPLYRGSQEATRAILAGRRDADRALKIAAESLDEERMMRRALEDLARRRDPLLLAGL